MGHQKNETKLTFHHSVAGMGIFTQPSFGFGIIRPSPGQARKMSILRICMGIDLFWH